LVESTNVPFFLRTETRKFLEKAQEALSMKKSENTVPKQKGDHLFKPGQSGNPKGRPKGALNKTTRAAMVLLENEAEDLTRAVIERAKSGDITALRLCF
jgi:hypothetical protein